MSAAELTVIIQNSVLLMAVVGVGFWLWPTVRLDCFRQNMFAIRDELFDYAASGKISFAHPAYKWKAAFVMYCIRMFTEQPRAGPQQSTFAVTVQVARSISLDKLRRIGYRMVDEWAASRSAGERSGVGE